MKLYTITLIVFLLFSTSRLNHAQTLEEIALEKIDSIETLISEVQELGIDVLKEKMTVRTAEVFLKYANWDENNVDLNTTYFELFWVYKNNASTLAADLPDHERNDVIVMLDEAITTLRLLKAGEIIRKPTPNVDWSQVSHDKDQLIFEDRPVFLADYTWKPGIPELDEYHGQLDGFFVSPTYVNDESGTINSNIISELDSKPDGKLGFIFLAQNQIPQWTKDKYGSEITDFTGDPFTGYDIDHPGTLEFQSLLMAGVAPKMSGKKYTQLGYMLCNEPRWITYKNGTNKVWYNVGVSKYTFSKFRVWLENKHGTIENLNTLWETDFVKFDSVKIDIPIDISLQGTPKWYDWVTFNDYRVLEYYKFLKAELVKNDPAAKVHLKIMPSFFSDNVPSNGIDLEALTEISDIIGNDAAAKNSVTSGSAPWQKNYSLDWREVYMSYDFLKSVSPNQIIFNSESHFLSTAHFRDLNLKPEYVRAIFWGAHTIGLSASQIWYWPRREDGSLRQPVSNGYAGSNNQQPRVTNEVHSTIMDLNSYSEEILKMQRQRKPIRIFYSKTSAANKHEYMDDLFELYEEINFEGLSLGFATKNIISNQDNSSWDVILAYKTEHITQAELDALQGYLDKGGTLIVDEVSLKKNEYEASLSGLKESSGKLLIVGSLEDIKEKAFELVQNKNSMPEVTITEVNKAGRKACSWKCVKNEAGNNVLSIINFGKTDAKLKIELKHAKIGTATKDLLKGIMVSSKPVLKPYQVYFVELTDAIDNVEEPEYEYPSGIKPSSEPKDYAKLYPNVTSGSFTIDFSESHTNINLRVFMADGKLVLTNSYSNVNSISEQITDSNSGLYIVQVIYGQHSQTFRLVKNG